MVFCWLMFSLSYVNTGGRYNFILNVHSCVFLWLVIFVSSLILPTPTHGLSFFGLVVGSLLRSMTHVKFIFLFHWDKVFLGSWGWFWIQDPSSSDTRCFPWRVETHCTGFLRDAESSWCPREPGWAEPRLPSWVVGIWQWTWSIHVYATNLPRV